jgi:hypothetical protein
MFGAVSLACLAAFALSLVLAPRPQRWFVSGRLIGWSDMSHVRIYTVSIPGSKIEERRVYYDFPPYGSLDKMAVSTSTRERNYVSKARNYDGRAPEFTADDEADYSEIAQFVERRLQGRPFVLGRPVFYEFEQKGIFDEQTSKISDAFRNQP